MFVKLIKHAVAGTHTDLPGSCEKIDAVSTM